jgi:hypothetical protein
MRALGHWPHG